MPGGPAGAPRGRFPARAASGLALLAALAAAPAGADLADTIARVKPSIVAVGTMLYTRRPPGNFVGTGFVVGDGRHAITNAHVIPDTIDTEKREFLAVLSGRAKPDVRRAKRIAADRVHDLALLRFEGAPLPAMRLGDAAAVREGEAVAFSGFPIGMVLGLRPVTHRGIVSAITPVAIPQITTGKLDVNMIRRLKKPYVVFQLDATAYPGNSGSPLYRREDGTVLGVINKVFVKATKEAVLEKPSGITYAIPVSHVRALLEKAGVAP